jgi:hypothetical protein
MVSFSLSPGASSLGFSPQPGWVEHDPEEIAASPIEVALKALSKVGVQAKDAAPGPGPGNLKNSAENQTSAASF